MFFFFTLVCKESLDRVIVQLHHIVVVDRVSVLVKLVGLLAVLIILVHHVA